eukprot:786227-Prymnesium_polylepis.1
MPAVGRLPLSSTFRYGSPLSDAASALVRHFKGSLHPSYAAFQIKGRRDQQTELVIETEGVTAALEEALALRGAGPPTCPALVVLARLNKTLFKEALQLVQTGGALVEHGITFATESGRPPRADECYE